MTFKRLHSILLGLALLLPASVPAEKISDVRNTRHNLSASGPGTAKATTETQVCVFCHTPHASTPGVNPLWNRRLSTATYTRYTSASLDANNIADAIQDNPGGSSKLCLSCHDGTLAIGNVNVLGGVGSADVQGSVSISMTGVGVGGVMPSGAGDTSGFTRKLGVDLTNDHPISLTFTDTLSARDGELQAVNAAQRFPADGSILGVREPGYKPRLPLEPTGPGGAGQIQCATCHDPHIRETDPTKGNQKFLRLNRFQETQGAAGFVESRDIFCLACHEKNRLGAWSSSAHANSQVATQTYKPAAADQREFPANLPVWKAGCLNCHDTHTVQGARRLLREGTDSATTPKAGGNAAMEQTCYQCHTDATASIITPNTTVPNIRADFQLARRMPIAVNPEVHDIGGNFNDAAMVNCSTTTNGCGKDMLESRSKLGVAALGNRHAECTDCHNPHRVVKFRDFRGNPLGSLAGAPDPAGTHRRDAAAGYVPSNIASGVLRGTFGVEPVYSGNSFHNLPTSYVVKRGDPGASVDASAAAPHVTREYQICLKCHSDYGYTDNNLYPAGNRPPLGYVGGTPSGTNGLTQYTNQAKEFQAPATHKGEVTTSDGGASATFSTNNHRSWHPVMDNTGRTAAVRGGANATARWVLPWSNAGAEGNQTMYCSDCHGSNVTAATGVVPDGGENGNAWGPHGSNNNFLLKGLWTTATGTGQQATGLCFKCHAYNAYATDSGTRTGFFDAGSGKGDLHSYHANKIGRMRCNWCHVAVTHGWKNKQFLVNLRDVGPEAGRVAGTVVAPRFSQAPYYMNSMLTVTSFARSGAWTDGNCSGKDWMKDNCSNPP